MTSAQPVAPAQPSRAQAVFRVISRRPHLRAGITFIVTLLTARHLEAADFGLWWSAIAVVALLTAWTGLGLEPSLREDLERKPEETALSLGTCMAMRVGAAVFAYVFLLWVTGDAPTGVRTLWLVAGITLFLQSPLSMHTWLEAKGQPTYSTIAHDVGFGVSALARVWLILGNVPVVWFAAVLALEATVSALVLFYAHGKIAPADDAFGWDKERARRWSHQLAVPLLRSLFAGSVFWVVAALLPWLSSPAEAGRLAASYTVLEFAVYCFVATMAARMAASSASPESADKAPNLSREHAEAAGVAAMKAAWIFAIVVGAAAPWLLRWIVGPSFESGSGSMAFRLLAFTAFPLALGSLRARLWQQARSRRHQTVADAVGLAVAVAASLLLVPRLGAFGGAISCLAALTVSQVGMSFVWADTRDTGRLQLEVLFLKPMWRSLKKPAIAPSPGGPATESDVEAVAEPTPQPPPGRPPQPRLALSQTAPATPPSA